MRPPMPPWWPVAAVLVACRLGRPPAPPAGALALHPGRVRSLAVEEGVGDAVRRGLGEALASRGAAGGGAAVDVEVLRWDEVAVAARAGEDGVRRIHGELAFSFTGPAPRRVVLRGERSYAWTAGDPAGSAAARAAASAALAAELAAEALDWYLYAPEREGAGDGR